MNASILLMMMIIIAVSIEGQRSSSAEAATSPVMPTGDLSLHALRVTGVSDASIAISETDEQGQVTAEPFSERSTETPSVFNLSEKSNSGSEPINRTHGEIDSSDTYERSSSQPRVGVSQDADDPLDSSSRTSMWNADGSDTHERSTSLPAVESTHNNSVSQNVDVPLDSSSKSSSSNVSEGAVHLAGIDIYYCPVWSCENRCFQKTIEASTGSATSTETPRSSEQSSIELYSSATSPALNRTDTREVTWCACDHSCVVLGDCCVDFFSLCLNVTDEAEVIRILNDAHNRSGDGSQAGDMTVPNLIRSYGSCVTSPEGERYTMVTSCPSSFSDNDVKTLCTKAEQHPNLQPYSEKNNMELTFRNINCAVCHGYRESTLVPWVRGINCPSNTSQVTSTNDSLSAYIHSTSVTDVVAAIRSGNCMHIYRLPASSTSQPRSCLPNPAILGGESHNVSDNSVTAPDSRCTFEDMLLCKAYSYQTFTSEEEEIKNPHCLKCMTGIAPVSVELPCARDDSTEADGKGLQNGGTQGILALFSGDSTSGANSIIVDGRKIPWSGFWCADNQVFDHVFLVCRDIFCPRGFRPVSGECSPVDQLFIPSDTQLLPSGTEYLYVSFEVGDNSVSCEDLHEDIYRVSFHNAYSHHNGDTSDETIPTLSLFCHNAGLNAEGTNRGNNTLSQNPTLEITVFPVSNISAAISASVDMITQMFLEDSNSIAVRNYEAEPHAVCREGNPQLIKEASIVLVDGEMYVEKRERNISLLYPLTSTMFRLRVTKTNESDHTSDSFCLTYVALLCVEPQLNSDLNCSSVAFNINKTRVENGTLYIIDTELSYPQSQYEMHEQFVLVCSEFDNLNDLWHYLEFFHFSDAQIYLSWACSLTSVACLVTSLVAFCSLSYLRNLAGFMTASLAGSLASGQVLILLDFDQPVVCSVVAAVSHFCWLAAFTWMTSLAVHMSCTFLGNLSTTAGKQDAKHIKREYRKYSIVSWGLPAVFVAVCFVLDKIEGTTLKVGYGSAVCGWMRQGYVFLVPVAIALSVNVLCFLLTLVSIERLMRASQSALSRQQKGERRRLVVYTKMFTVMGFTWAAGFAAAFTGEVALWWVYILLNGLQGSFVAFSFFLNARLIRVLKAKLSEKRKKKVGRECGVRAKGRLVDGRQGGVWSQGLGRGGVVSAGSESSLAGCGGGGGARESGMWFGGTGDGRMSASSITMETKIDL